MTEPAVPPSAVQPQGEDKTVAILSYITLIGFIVAIIIHGSKKTQLGTYHLRQGLGLVITWIVLLIVTKILGIGLVFIPVLGWMLILVLHYGLWLSMLALMVLGVVAAANGQKKPLPLVGPLFEKWFGNAFA